MCGLRARYGSWGVLEPRQGSPGRDGMDAGTNAISFSLGSRQLGTSRTALACQASEAPDPGGYRRARGVPAVGDASAVLLAVCALRACESFGSRPMSQMGALYCRRF